MNDHAGHSHSEIVGYFGPVSVSAVEEVAEEEVAEEVADEGVAEEASQHSADRVVCEVSAWLPHQRPGATPGRTQFTARMAKPYPPPETHTPPGTPGPGNQGRL